MDIQVVLPKKDGVIMVGDKWLHINKDTRDALCSANAFLTILADRTDCFQTQMSIVKIIGHISGMLYGFEENE